jgi:hypothetical protein
MPAAIQSRDTQKRNGDNLGGPLAAAVYCFAGTLACLNAANTITKGATSTALRVIGVFTTDFDNTAGVAGAVTAKVERDGWYLLANSAAADQITLSDVGADCFMVDDQTVAKTNGASTRSIAGVVRDVDTRGVWISFK